LPRERDPIAFDTYEKPGQMEFLERTGNISRRRRVYSYITVGVLNLEKFQVAGAVVLVRSAYPDQQRCFLSAIGVPSERSVKR